MRRVIFGSFVLVVAALALFGFANNQAPQLDAKQLRTMLSQLGYEIKDLNTVVGEEKYEIKVPAEGFDVYVAYEVSKSKNYVWLTVLLGDSPSESKALAMLKETSKIQPSMFYISSTGKLMMGLAIDNRGITNAIVRQRTDAICEDVVDTAPLWNK